jgi:prepilin peptidase CpaA
MLQSASIVMLPSLMIIAAMSDITTYRIPNWLTGLTALLFFPMALATGMPVVEFGWHVLAGVILFFVGYGLFSLKLFGGGDAKLMAAAGFWFGTSQLMFFILMTAIAGGGLAFAFALYTAVSKNWGQNTAKIEEAVSKKLVKKATKLPYGIALCVGALLAFPQTWWMNQIS